MTDLANSDSMTWWALTASLSIGTRKEEAAYRLLATRLRRRFRSFQKNTVEMRGKELLFYNTQGVEGHRLVCSTPDATWVLDVPHLHDVLSLTHAVRTLTELAAHKDVRKWDLLR